MIVDYYLWGDYGFFRYFVFEFEVVWSHASYSGEVVLSGFAYFV